MGNTISASNNATYGISSFSIYKINLASGGFILRPLLGALPLDFTGAQAASMDNTLPIGLMGPSNYTEYPLKVSYFHS